MKLVTFIVSDDDADTIWNAWEGDLNVPPRENGGYPMVICNDLMPYKEGITSRLTLDSIKDM